MARFLRAAIATVLTALAIGVGVSPAAAADSVPPVVLGITPAQLVPNGRPLQVTLTGQNLGSATQIFVTPVVTNRSFVTVGDSTLIVTLPADLGAGQYSIRAASTAGSSDPAAAEFMVASAIARVDAGPPRLPRYSFAPAPQPRYQPTTGVVDPIPSATLPAPSHAPVNPLLLLPLGIILGGAGYLLWGRPGRLSAADRQGLLAHLVGRPLQALHVGRICLQCGRLHLVLATRSDLWQAGQFCSATCFVAAQEDDSAARAGESTAVTRMREMFVYSELEQNLQAALAGEVLELRTGAAPLDEVPLPEPAAEELVEAAG